jgi:HEAT repeat protein
MKKRIIRTLAGVIAGILIIIAAIWVLTMTLGNIRSLHLYAGQPMDYWRGQLYGGDAGASNAAYAVVDAQIIPKLVDAMLHDTNDSQLRVSLIGALNELPGIQIDYQNADARRIAAAAGLGEIGPVAGSAVPSLIESLQAKSFLFEKAVITSLGKIHAEPQTVVPIVIPYLDDDNLNEYAMAALAEFGSTARAAVPKLLPLLRTGDRFDRLAATEALQRIDPDAAAKAGVK